MLHNTFLPAENGNTETIVLLHGFGGDSRIWKYQMPLLAKNFNVLAIDLPSHSEGNLRLSQLDITLDAISREILAVCDEYSVDHAIFMGVSMGTIFVKYIEAFYPEYVELAKERWRKLSRLSGQRQLKSQIKIADYAWRTVDLDDREEVERVKHAVNYTNRLAYVTTYYTINEEKELMSVHSTTSIHDSSMIPNMKEYLHNILRCFFAAYELLNTELLVLKREDAGRKDYADSNLQYGLGLGEMPTC